MAFDVGLWGGSGAGLQGPCGAACGAARGINKGGAWPHNAKGNAMHMMLDIETLALETKAVVFQIGVVLFDLKGDMPVKIRYDLDVLPQIMAGRIVDPETQKWWMAQDRNSWLQIDTISCIRAINGLNSVFEDKRVQYVWANSPSFDCNILRSLAKDFQCNLAWDFRSEMDVRTLKTMNSIAGLQAADRVATTHDALKDCIDQVNKVVFYWNNIFGAEQQDIVTSQG